MWGLPFIVVVAIVKKQVLDIYILDARRGALKRPPSRATFRRSDAPTLRRWDVVTLRLQHRRVHG